MNEIVKNYKDNPVRIVQKDGEPWFVAKDVCRVLEIKDPHKSVACLDEDEKGWHTMPTLGGEQQMAVVSEAGLYSLILRSRKPEAKSFKRWVTHEVLPAIRKTGAYLAPNMNLDAIKALVGKLADQTKKLLESNAELREKNEYLLQFRPKSYLGDISKANGMPKCGIRSGSWVAGKGRKAKRLDPTISGFLQLDLWYDYVPMALLAETVNVVNVNCPKLLEASNA